MCCPWNAVELLELEVCCVFSVAVCCVLYTSFVFSLCVFSILFVKFLFVTIHTYLVRNVLESLHAKANLVSSVSTGRLLTYFYILLIQWTIVNALM